VLRVRERTSIPFHFIVFTFGLIIESIKEFGVRHMGLKILELKKLHVLVFLKKIKIIKPLIKSFGFLHILKVQKTFINFEFWKNNW
jgi:hypothetical protein